MTAIGTRAKEGGRQVLKLACLAVFLAFGSSVAVIEETQAASVCSNIDPQTNAMIQEAIASQPALANNPEAQAAYMAILAQESAYNSQAVGKYVNAAGEVTAASFGLGQVNYYSHQAEVNALVLAGTGQNLATSNLSYNEKKAIAGQWLLDNPQAATNLSAQIFAQNLNAAGGDISKATHNYNGGSDPQYLAHVQNKLEQLQACNLATSGVVLSNESVGSTSNSEVVLDCPNFKLAQALDKATQDYAARVFGAAQSSFDQGVESARKSDDKHFLGNIGDKYCFSNYDQFIEKLLGLFTNPLNAFLNFVFSAVVQALNAACNYAVAVVNNALNSICIPLPDISLPGFSINGPDRKYCNGVSLATFWGLNRRPLNPDWVPRYPHARDILMKKPIGRKVR